MISRRALTAAVAAIPTGVLGGTLLQRWTKSDASIRFLGTGGSMVALLDSGSARTMFFLGSPNTGLLENLPQLRTFGNARLDLVVASHQWLTTAGIRNAINLTETTTISLQGDFSPGQIVGNVTPVTDDQTIELGDNTTVQISVRTGLDNDANDPGVLVEVLCEGSRIAMANTASALEELFVPVHLLAVPGIISHDVIHAHSPAVFVGTELHNDASIAEYLAYYNEPIAFTIVDGEIARRKS